MAAVTTAAELRAVSAEDLAEKLAESKEELFNLRFQNATGQLDNTARLRAVRKDIARIYTVLRERELGIRATPVAVEAPVKETKAKKTKKTDDSADAEKTVADETKEA